jgi:hypothetical protein
MRCCHQAFSTLMGDDAFVERLVGAPAEQKASISLFSALQKRISVFDASAQVHTTITTTQTLLVMFVH